MLKNYLKTAFRNISRHKGYSFINLLGLSIGIACCILILLYVQDEFSFDRYVPEYQNTYRIVLDIETPEGGDIHMARTPPPWGPSLAEEYPEVESYMRFKTPLVSWLVSNEAEDKRFHEKGFYFADHTVFDFFDFELLKGDPETALLEPRTVVLTVSSAERYFGNRDPMGQTLRLDNTHDFLVTGIMEDVPRNSHFSFDILASISTLGAVAIYGDTDYHTWRRGLAPDLYTYIRLQEGASPVGLEAKLPEFLRAHMGAVLDRANVRFHPRLQPLSDIHLHSNLQAEIRSNSDIRYVYIFSAIAIFVLIIACINFMNLATARSAGRAQEVGLRKVVGAQKSQLISQFVGESTILAFLALIVALVLVQVFLPFFNSLSGKSLSLDLGGPLTLLGLVGLTLLVGILSGSYPAFFLSSFEPVAVFRGSLKAGRANAWLRKFLVVFQFALSIIFIIGTGVVHRQLHYVRNKVLGFDKEQVVVLPMGDPRARQIYLTFKERAQQSPRVTAVAGTSSVPGGLIGLMVLLPEGAEAGNEVTMETFFVDHDFVEAMGIEIAAGRDFSLEYTTDANEAFILNETAVRQLGWEDQPLGKQITIQGFRTGRVIGVVKDFHAKSLHQRIEPLVLQIAPDPDAFLQLVARIAPGNIEDTLDDIRAAWAQVYPNDPFTFTFLDEDFDSLYRSERMRGRIFLTFSLLAVFIACLGLLGLASFTAEQKTKEIGIRKVLGATEASIVRLLSLEFIRLVLAAGLIAFPVAYLIMDSWLKNFAYRIHIPWELFLLSTGLAVVIALVTVSFQAVRASLTNPVDSIRTE
jgi:putative ABC transport system permease protein